MDCNYIQNSLFFVVLAYLLFLSQDAFFFLVEHTSWLLGDLRVANIGRSFKKLAGRFYAPTTHRRKPALFSVFRGESMFEIAQFAENTVRR